MTSAQPYHCIRSCQRFDAENAQSLARVKASRYVLRCFCLLIDQLDGIHQAEETLGESRMNVDGAF